MKEKDVLDIVIGEVDLLRRKIEALVLLLDEKGVIARDEFEAKVREVTEEEKLDMLIKMLEKRKSDARDL